MPQIDTKVILLIELAHQSSFKHVDFIFLSIAVLIAKTLDAVQLEGIDDLNLHIYDPLEKALRNSHLEGYIIFYWINGLPRIIDQFHRDFFLDLLISEAIETVPLLPHYLNEFGSCVRSLDSISLFSSQDCDLG